MDNIYEIRNLYKEFEIRQSILDRIGKPKKHLSAVHNVNLDIFRNEVLSIVGESGCGKSTLARVLMLLYNDYEGDLCYDGQNLRNRGNAWISKEYRRQVQMVFQDPYSCLNPSKTVEQTLMEVLDVHKLYDSSEREKKVLDILEKCGLSPAICTKYPNELSGGQCQRVGVARALLLEPKVLIADEPISALDVSVQAQVINLLKELKTALNLTMIFISHDLSVVKYISDRVAVMYLGEIVEIGLTEDVFENTMHPYTLLLLNSAPKINTGSVGSNEVETVDIEELPNAIDVPSGCRFHTRCPYAKRICSEESPVLREYTTGHSVACHLIGEIND